MKKIRLGKTELMVTKPALGCLPLQRCDREYAIRLIRAAYDAGINFYDTANAYTDSESKLGEAFEGIRQNVIIATKSMNRDKEGVLTHIRNSLKTLKTDYIDIFQFHNVPSVPDPEDENGAYAGALEAKKRGYIRHIGVTSHRVDVAEQCIATGNFETLQFPFSYISSERDLALAEKCKAADMGFIAMKGLAGGLLTNVDACHAFMEEYDNVVPIWGMQKLEELHDWVDAAERNVRMNDELRAAIQRDREMLQGSFCRSCGYCMPCPVGISIRDCARMNMLLRRSPWKQYYTPEWREKMEKINDCLGCGQCKQKCPYGLDTPALLKYMLDDYNKFFEEHKGEI